MPELSGRGDLIHPNLSSVFATAAATDTDEHDEAPKDLKYAADVAQDDAVSDLQGGGRRQRGDRGDVGEDVRVPGDGDDGQDTRTEDQQSTQTCHHPVGPVSPAADTRNGHSQPDQSHDEGGHHQTLGDGDDVVAEVVAVLLAALGPGVGGGGDADIPDTLLHDLIFWAALDVLDGSPVGGHSGGQVQDPPTGSHDQPEDQDPRSA